jgi:hypothetical protein
MEPLTAGLGAGMIYGAVYGLTMRAARARQRAMAPTLLAEAAALRTEALDAAKSWRQRRIARHELRVVADPGYLLRLERTGFLMALAFLIVLLVSFLV